MPNALENALKLLEEPAEGTLPLAGSTPEPAAARQVDAASSTGKDGTPTQQHSQKERQPQHDWLEKQKASLKKNVEVKKISKKSPQRAKDIEELLEWQATAASSRDDLERYRDKYFAARSLANLSLPKDPEVPPEEPQLSTADLKAKARELQPHLKPGTDNMKRLEAILALGDKTPHSNLENYVRWLLEAGQEAVRNQLPNIQGQEPELAQVIDNLVKWNELSKDSTRYELERAEACLNAANKLIELYKEFEELAAYVAQEDAAAS